MLFFSFMYIINISWKWKWFSICHEKLWKSPSGRKTVDYQQITRHTRTILVNVIWRRNYIVAI